MTHSPVAIGVLSFLTLAVFPSLAAPSLSIEETEARIVVSYGSQEVLTYHKAEVGAARRG